MSAIEACRKSNRTEKCLTLAKQKLQTALTVPCGSCESCLQLLVGKVLLCQRTLQQTGHASIAQYVLQIEAFVSNVAAACGNSPLSSKRRRQQGASSHVPFSCSAAHQQALPGWPCALTQVEPALDSCMSAIKACSKRKETEKCLTLTTAACLSSCEAVRAAYNFWLARVCSANAACSKVSMSALHKLYCR